jgi:hypothetical protein
MTELTNESYMLNLTVDQIRVLHLALEKYIRNHDIILHDSKFSINEMKLVFADLSRYCELCKTLNDILIKHDSQPYKEKV